MSIIFFVKSASVDISKYTIKNLPGSSGRLDVISRCILAVLLNKDRFERNVQIWIFLEKYGTFIFDSEQLEYDTLPKNELLLADFLVDLIQNTNSTSKLNDNPLSSVQTSKMDIFDALKQFKKLNYNIFVLSEGGEDFFTCINELHSKDNMIFVIGSQSGEFISSKELSAMDFTNVSFGPQSYLASSVILLIKLYIMKFL
jgi:tRNA (pseudouridine54-N1)-methyltransferase